MAKKKNYPERYELKIPRELKGKMEPDFIRWAVTNRDWLSLVKQFQTESLSNGNFKIDINMIERAFYNGNS